MSILRKPSRRSRCRISSCSKARPLRPPKKRDSARGARLLAAQAYWQGLCRSFCARRFEELPRRHASRGSQSADYAGGQQVKARNLTVLARIMNTDGQESQSMELREEVLRIQQQIGSRKDVIGALINLADLQGGEGNIAEAQKNEKEAIGIAREIKETSSNWLTWKTISLLTSTRRAITTQARTFYADSSQNRSRIGRSGRNSRYIAEYGLAVPADGRPARRREGRQPGAGYFTSRSSH